MTDDPEVTQFFTDMEDPLYIFIGDEIIEKDGKIFIKRSLDPWIYRPLLKDGVKVFKKDIHKYIGKTLTDDKEFIDLGETK